MITRQYYGWLQDNNLIQRGDYQRISEICKEKGLPGITGGELDRKAIFYIVSQGRLCSEEVSSVIREYFETRKKSIDQQNKVIAK
jgi:hypothetical protein